MTSNNLAACALAAALTAALAIAATPASADDKDMEKCYGISKAGGNDCASEGSNSCAGTSKADFDGKAWKLVKKGTCASTEITLPDGKKRTGSLEPISG